MRLTQGDKRYIERNYQTGLLRYGSGYVRRKGFLKKQKYSRYCGNARCRWCAMDKYENHQRIKNQRKQAKREIKGQLNE